MNRLFVAVLFSALIALPTQAAGTHPPRPHPDPDSTASWHERFSLSGYGVANYFAYDWETDPERRNVMDLERFVMYGGYEFSERIRLLTEIEFEHGGTGVTKEFDQFEEFGEFENEIEKGGEVKLEQMNLRFAWNEALAVRVGRLELPVGLASTDDEPVEYFTTTRSPVEATLIPTNWYETGIQLAGRWRALTYSGSVVNGLSSAGFSSSNWIQDGSQSKFENVMAEDLALGARLDYHFDGEKGDKRVREEGGGEEKSDEEEEGEGGLVGASAYYGDSADNRRKTALRFDGQDYDAYVTVLDAHAQGRFGPLTARGVVLFGDLQNAHLVSKANQRLSGNLNAQGTPVGSRALGYYAEAAYDLLALLPLPGNRLDAFARYAFYDSMYETTGDVFDNPFWERRAITGGLNLHVIDDVVLKAQYAHRTRGTDETEDTFSAGFGFEF